MERAAERLGELRGRGTVDVPWIAIGGLVRGDAIDDERVRTITSAGGRTKSKLLRRRCSLPSFLPFLVHTTPAGNVLPAMLGAPESGAAGRLGA